MKLRASYFLTAVLAVTYAVRSAAGDLPFVPFPNNVKVVVVGEDIKINGLPLLAYEFNSTDSVEEVAKFYRETWTEARLNSDADMTPFLETRLGQWLVLSRLEKKHNITVQIEKSILNSTHVLVGVSPLPKYVEEGRRNVDEVNMPKLIGMQIISRVASKDRGELSEIYWIDSKRGIEPSLEEFKQYYDTHGGTTKGYKLEEESSKESRYGTLSINTDKAFLRFDAVKMNDKTRIIALWKPH